MVKVVKTWSPTKTINRNYNLWMFHVWPYLCQFDEGLMLAMSYIACWKTLHGCFIHMFYFHPCGSKNAKKMGVFASMIHSHKGHMSWNILEWRATRQHHPRSLSARRACRAVQSCCVSQMKIRSCWQESWTKTGERRNRWHQIIEKYVGTSCFFLKIDK